MRKLVGVSLAVLVLGTVPASAFDTIRVGDLAGTGGRWQVGEVTVAAPVRDVQAWFDDAAHWKERFPDIEWVQLLGNTPDGRSVVRFRSRVIGRPLTIRRRIQPGLTTYEGSGKDVNVQGRVYFQAVTPGTTRVIIQTTSDVHGLAGAFLSEHSRRERSFRKLRSDLTAATQLAHAWAAAHRARG